MYIELDKVKYKVEDIVKIPGIARGIPLLDIPVMSDEEWEKRAKENAVSNYRRETGRDPESIECALRWQRARFA